MEFVPTEFRLMPPAPHTGAVKTVVDFITAWFPAAPNHHHNPTSSPETSQSDENMGLISLVPRKEPEKPIGEDREAAPAVVPTEENVQPGESITEVENTDKKRKSLKSKRASRRSRCRQRRLARLAEVKAEQS